MDPEQKAGVFRNAAVEVVTYDELVELFRTVDHPVAYDGFEPSGLAHLPLGVYRPLLLKQLLTTGVKFKLLLADTFAIINDKLGGEAERVHTAGEYFIEVWKAAGIPFGAGPGKVEAVWHTKFAGDGEYWKKVLAVAHGHTEARTKRALTIAGRKEDEVRQAAQLFYPSMQASDIFHFSPDPAREPIICQLGMDQRKANMLARDVAEGLGYKKPVAVHHRMLTGLDGMQSASVSDENFEHKMSKSRPSTCIFVHDSTEEIKAKLAKAYCPAKVAEGNPVLEYAREILFRAGPAVEIERPAKFGGNASFSSYAELERAYLEGSLHPMDLKNAVACGLDALIEPVRSHFESGAPKRLYEKVRDFDVTR